MSSDNEAQPVPKGAALMAGGRIWQLPGHAQIVPPPLLRPTPARAPGLLGLALIGGRAVPAFCMADAPGPVWLICDSLDGSVLLNGDVVLDPAPPEAEVWRMPALKAVNAPRLLAQSSSGLGGGRQQQPCSAEARSVEGFLGA